MLVLSHEVIPHHHHDSIMGEIYALHKHDEQDSRHKTTVHHHHADNQKHNSPQNPEKGASDRFPLHHHHISPTNDFDYLRMNVIRDVVFNFHLLAVINTFFQTVLSEPPELDFIRFTEKPFYITARFEPGAIGLRAPPSFA